jgi:hypothetical protein
MPHCVTRDMEEIGNAPESGTCRRTRWWERGCRSRPAARRSGDFYAPYESHPIIADRWDEQREESGAGSTAAQRPVNLDEAELHGCREIRIVRPGQGRKGE